MFRHFTQNLMSQTKKFRNLDKFRQTLAKLSFTIGVYKKGKLTRLEYTGEEVSCSMENSNADTEHICHQFDAFCRKIVRDERKTYMADKAKRRDSEVLFSDLTDAQELLISLTDEYPSEQFCFVVQDQEIFIHDSQLAEMLGKLPEEKRDPLLLTYWFGMRDQEIADVMKLAHSTVNYRRNSTLETLRKMVGEHDSHGETEG